MATPFYSSAEIDTKAMRSGDPFQGGVDDLGQQLLFDPREVLPVSGFQYTRTTRIDVLCDAEVPVRAGYYIKEFELYNPD